MSELKFSSSAPSFPIPITTNRAGRRVPSGSIATGAPRRASSARRENRTAPSSAADASRERSSVTSGRRGAAGEVARRDPGDLPVLHPAQVAFELLLRRAPVRGRQGLARQRVRPGTPKHPALEEEELEDLRAPGDLFRDELRAPQQRPDRREKVLAGERPLQEVAGKGIDPPRQVENEKVRVGRVGGGAADAIPSGVLPRKAAQEIGEQGQGAGRVPDADLTETIGGGAVSPGGGNRVQRKRFRRARARGGL